ncbi:MAG: hypothetical protein KDK11_00720 [Maritimibacter sp.]|nr:hypothetical protein [Maritimibacter sp.]
MPKLTECSVCGGQVSTDAKTCPHCGQKQRAPRETRTFFKLLLFGAVAFVLVQTLNSGDDGGKASTVGTANAPPVDTTNMSAEELEAHNARFRLSASADDETDAAEVEQAGSDADPVGPAGQSILHGLFNGTASDDTSP